MFGGEGDFASSSSLVLQQGVGHVAVLPAHAGGLAVLVQMGGLAEALATLETSVGFLPRVHADVFLAVGQREEGLAADFACVLASALDHQDVVLRQRLLALGQDVRRGAGQLRGEGGGSATGHVVATALVQQQGARQARGGRGGVLEEPDHSVVRPRAAVRFRSYASVTWVSQGGGSRRPCPPQGVEAQTGALEVQTEGISPSTPPAANSATSSGVPQTVVQGAEEQRLSLKVVYETIATLATERTRLQKGGRSRAGRPTSFLPEQEVVRQGVAGCRVGEVVFSSVQPCHATPEILGAEKAGDAETGFATQPAVTAVASPSNAALEEQLGAGREQAVGARLGLRGEAAFAALWAKLRLLLLAAGPGLHCHVADFVRWFRRAQRLSFNHHLREAKEEFRAIYLFYLHSS